jgi:photosystem II stability/assembly factor-like uncharacterized protein
MLQQKDGEKDHDKDGANMREIRKIPPAFQLHSDSACADDADRRHQQDPGGLTWALRGTPVSTVLYDVAFVDRFHGFIAGAAGTFLRTTDGGTSWTSRPATTSRDLRGLTFLTADDGWVAGDYGTILRTFSGGE